MLRFALWLQRISIAAGLIYPFKPRVRRWGPFDMGTTYIEMDPEMALAWRRMEERLGNAN